MFSHEATGTWGGPTESPFVVAHGGRYLLFIGPTEYKSGWDGYATTRVLASDDALFFAASSEVARINAHAAEVIVDSDGSTWVSHCRWGQGGVYLARLYLGE